MDNFKNKELRLKVEFFLTQIKRLWVIVLITTILGAGFGGLISSIKYKPEYSASQVFSIDIKNVDVSSEKITDSQLSKTVPALFSSDVFIHRLQPYINEANCSGQFRVASISSTNLFSLYILAPSNKDCEEIIRIFKEHYAEVADDIIGPSEINYFTSASTSPFPSNSPKYIKNISIGALFGLAVILLIIYLMGLLADPITSQKEAEDLINSKCLTTINTIKTKKRTESKKASKHQMPLITDSDSPLELSQSISSLATKIEAWCNENNQNSILFTSTISGEGKSSIAINTALELSSKGKKVLVVDADLRSPSVLEYLGISSENDNITKLINGEILIDDAVEKNNDIYTLSNSQPDNKAFENVTSHEFNQIIEDAKNRFDYVIIDTPPVGMLGDAISISDCADAYIYVISFNYVGKSAVQHGLHSLTGSNAKALGFVINYEK